MTDTHRLDTYTFILVNVCYWSFLGLMAFYVSPWILVAIAICPGYSTKEKVTVEIEGTTITVQASELSRRDIETAVKEARSTP